MKTRTFPKANFLLFLLTLFFPGGGELHAQEPHPDLKQVFMRQLYDYPQEKLYLHTDRSHYVGGDTIWFRAYKVDALTHLPDTLSRYVYVELVNPADSVVSRTMVCDIEHQAPGHIVLDENIAGGNYTLRAYTHYMLNQGEDYFFIMPLKISNPYSSYIFTAGELARGGDGKVSGGIKVDDRRSAGSVRPANIYIGSEQGNISRYTLNDGAADVSYMNVPRKVSPGTIYVEYDNRLAEYVEVSPFPGDFDVSFFPEGGHLLSGVTCQVGFKALDGEGYGIYIKGEVYDSGGNQAAEIESLFAGMGKFVFIPRAAESYYALCRTEDGTEKKFELPPVLSEGVGLRVIQSKEKLLIAVQCSGGTNIPEGLRIALHVRGELLYDSIYDGRPYIAIDTGLMPAGVCHILLADPSGGILSERLVFIPGNEEVTVNFSTDKNVYGYRDWVACEVELADFDGFPVRGDFSVSVTDDNDIAPDYRDNILSTLLLTSELRGYIESPGWYFDPANGFLAVNGLDALMLTQGWRRYDMEKLFKGTISEPTEYFEKSKYITGRATRLTSGRPSANTSVMMFVPRFGAMLSTVTDMDGSFVFGNIECPDSTVYYIQAYSAANDQKVRLTVDGETFPVFTIPALPAALNLNVPADKEPAEVDRGYLLKSDERSLMEHGMRTLEIEKIRITADAVKKEENPIEARHLRNLGGHGYDEKFLEQRSITRLEQLIPLMPNTIIVGDHVYTRGGRTGNFSEAGIPVSFVVDGIVMPEGWNWDDYDLRSAESVELVNDSRTAIFGSRGGGGVIIITSRPGGRNNAPVNRFDNKAIMPLGYQEPLEFYSPAYDTDASKYNRKKDLRTTIYWNPSLRTDDNGKASFGFYSSDALSTYSVVVEGLTEDGRIIRKVGKVIRK